MKFNHSCSCNQSEYRILFYAENPFYVSLYRLSTVRSSEWKQRRDVWVNVICPLLFSDWRKEGDVRMPLFTKYSLSLSYYHIVIGKQPLSRSEGRIMHPPVDFLRSQHIERSTVGLSVHWQPASAPCHVPRFVVGPTASQPCIFDHCSRHFLQSNTLFTTSAYTFRWNFDAIIRPLRTWT